MGELVGGGYTLLYVYYLVWYTDLGGRGVFRRLTSLLFKNICHLQWQVNLMGAFTLLWFFLNIFVLKVNCDLYICVIYVREDNDSNVFQVMITRLEWTTWTRMSVVPKRLLKFNYSLIQLNCWYWCLCPPGCVVVMVTPHVNQAQVKLKQLKT